MSFFTRALLSNGRRLISLSSSSLASYSGRTLLRNTSAISSIINRIDSKKFASNVPLNKREQELTDFLSSEIDLERESQNSALPKSLADWQVTQSGSDIVLFKKFNDEEITIKANVCYSVDAVNPESENGQMVCKPDFAIEIKKGNSILGLNCSYIQEDENMDDGQRLEDDFQINEISIYEGEFQKNNYAISGEVIDGNLYDLLMNVLEGRGIDQKFAKNLVEYATVYEHGLYVELLENMKKFFQN